ncbi:MAG: hypothetical protein ACFNT6_05055 [Neisseria sp.]|uniref:hypothetical protein n=1 Tax=Neisseria sp. TaxID=192066 RepID=UPI00361142FA
MSSGKIQGIVKELIHNHPIQPNWLASEFIRNYWEQYKAEYENNQSINGGVFEQLIILSLLRENISPIYTQAKLAFVPNVNLDIVLYNRKTPITISAKTTLRERWKQADLEAMATKYVHRQAKCYVLTLSESEVSARRRDSNSYMGIDSFVLAHTEEYDNLIEELKSIHISESESIRVIETDQRIYNQVHFENKD